MDKLNELVKKRINRIILTEKFGISCELDDKINEAYILILDNLRNAKKEKDEDGYIISKCSVSLEFFGTNLKINVIKYYFNNEKEYNDFINRGLRVGGFITTSSPLIITMFSINGIIKMNDFCDTLGHEMEHAYQEVKSGKSSRTQLRDLMDDRLFTTAQANLNSPNRIKRSIADCIYLSNNKEQDAFVNGLFQDYKSNPYRDFNDVIFNSEATIWLKRYYESYLFIKKNKDNPIITNELSIYFTKYGSKSKNKENKRFPNVNKFLNFVYDNLKRYEWKYSRAIFHCRETFLTSRKLKFSGKNEINEQIYTL